MPTMVLLEFFSADTERSIKLRSESCLRPYITQMRGRDPIRLDLKVKDIQQCLKV